MNRLIFFIIFFLVILLRFWRIGDTFIFDIDTQYQALLAKTIINHFHIIWIGVSASNIGYYLGPGLVYLTALLLWLLKGDPVILGYFASFIGFVTVVSLAYIVHDLYGKKAAVISATIYGFSSFIIFYDRKYWPIFVPLVALWIFYSLVKSKRNPRWLIVSIILISLAYHIHLTLFIFWPFIIWAVFKAKKKIVLSTWLTMIGSYFIITFPLLVFDFVHNFDNMFMPLRFITGMFKKSAHIGQLNFDLLLSSLNKIIFYNHQNYPYVPYLFTAGYMVMAITILIMRKSYSTMLLISITILYMLFFGLYPGPIQEYYIVFLFPFIALLTGLTLSKIPLIIVIPILILFITINTVTTLTYRNNRGLAVKKNLIKKVTAHLNADYYLSYDSAMDYEGWRYLFEAYGKKPAASKADEMFGWIYRKDVSPNKPELKVIITTNPQLKFNRTIKKLSSGPYIAFILRNE